MFDVLRRIFLFTLAAAVISYVLFVAVGILFYARADESDTVWIRDEISPNMHRLAGLIPVPSACAELIQETEMISPLLYKLRFRTWDNPNIECEKGEVKKEFHEIIFAPAVGVHFIATMDDIPLDIIVVPYRP